MEYAVVSIGLYLDQIILTCPHDYIQLNKTYTEMKENVHHAAKKLVSGCDLLITTSNSLFKN